MKLLNTNTLIVVLALLVSTTLPAEVCAQEPTAQNSGMNLPDGSLDSSTPPAAPSIPDSTSPFGGSTPSTNPWSDSPTPAPEPESTPAPVPVPTPKPTPQPTQKPATAPSAKKGGPKVKTTRKVVSLKKKSLLEEMGTSLIFSADIGLLTAVPSATLIAYKSKTGVSIEGKALGSVLLDKFIVDAGLGWYFYNVSGTEPIYINGKILVDEDLNPITDDVGIKLSGTILEVSPSYRLTKSIFTGPTLQLRYPSDLGYDSQIPRKAMGIYLGLQGGYQMFEDDLNTRFVGKLMMPVNYKDWAALHTMVGIQIGLPFTQPEVLTIHESTVKTTEKRVVEYRKQVYRFKLTRDVIKLVLDNLIVFYPEPGYPTMTTEAQSFLIDLSQSLIQNEANWATLQVDTVSRDHARSVRDSIVSAGVMDKKVRIGVVIPGDKTVANPPVEFTFKGVKNQAQLMDAVRRAMKQMSIPETCEGGVCQ